MNTDEVGYWNYYPEGSEPCVPPANLQAVGFTVASKLGRRKHWWSRKERIVDTNSPLWWTLYYTVLNFRGGNFNIDVWNMKRRVG